MTLIIGLGNPGKEYEKSRHNIGWRVIEAFAETRDGAWKIDKKLQALIRCHPEIVEGPRPSTRQLPITNYQLPAAVVLLKPLTFMNLSGAAVAAIIKRLRCKPDSIIVIHDDIDLPFGTLRVSFGSSAGGHNGVQSLIDHLNTKDFWRLRIGVAPAAARDDWKQRTDPKDFVLKQFTGREEKILTKTLPAIIDILRTTIDHPAVQTIHLNNE